MKLTIYHSDKGDCTLLSSSDGKNILADGGMSASYKKHVAPELNLLHQKGEALDLVYVSHIDQDHIAGILKLMDDILDWRVYRLHEASGDSEFKKPKYSKEPPVVKKIWHNSFHEQVGKNAGDIGDMLAANAPLISTLEFPWAQEVARYSDNLATSMAEAVKLSRRISSRQLGISLNPEFKGRLMFVDGRKNPISIGNLSIWIIGPKKKDLDNLRKKWIKWLRSQKGKKQLRKIRKVARRDEELLGTNEFESFIKPINIEASELGDRSKVTPPNLASLMLFIEENKKKILMTGDGHWKDILDGLKACKKLNAKGNLHVDVLKVQHHGSEHNTAPEFCKALTADHYVFCGNGFEENPDLKVVDAFIDSRIGKSSERSRNAEVKNPFTFWFNASEKMTKQKYQDHMKEIKKLVLRAGRRSKGQMKSRFLTRGKFVLNI